MILSKIIADENDAAQRGCDPVTSSCLEGMVQGSSLFFLNEREFIFHDKKKTRDIFDKKVRNDLDLT